MSDQRPPLTGDDAEAFPGTPRPGLTEADMRKPLPEWGWDEERQQLLIGALVAFFLFLMFGGGMAMLGLGGDAEDLADEAAAVLEDGGVDTDAGDLERDVRGQLGDDDLRDGVSVDEGDDGIITLEGEVESENYRSEAVAAAAAVIGVDQVIDNLTVAEEEEEEIAPEPDPIPVEDSLLDRVKAAEATAGFGAIAATDADGVITLEGEVESEEAKADAEAEARSVDGVVDVTNNLVVAAGNADLAAEVRAAEDAAGFTAIDAGADGETAILDGEVETEELKIEAEQVALAVEGITSVENNLVVAQLPDSDVTVDIAGTEINASGNLPDEAAAQTVDGVIGGLSGVGTLAYSLTGVDGTVVVRGTADSQEQRDEFAGELSTLADDLGFDYDDTEYVVAGPSLEQALNDLVALEPVNFDTSSAQITGGESAVLDQAAEVLLGAPDGNVTVEGHTDSDGADAANQALSQARAESVIAYLANKGVNAERLTGVGFGESQPIAPNETAEGKAANRRVVFKVG